MVFDRLVVWLDSYCAIIVKAYTRISKKLRTLKHVIGHYRLKYIEFVVALCTGDSHSSVVTHDLSTHHGDGLSLRRVYFTRHDRRTRLVRRNNKLPNSRARTRSQHANVIRNLIQAYSQLVQCAMSLN